MEYYLITLRRRHRKVQKAETARNLNLYSDNLKMFSGYLVLKACQRQKCFVHHLFDICRIGVK